MSVPEFFVRDGEMSEDTEMDEELPDIFMSVRLSSPSVLREKTEEEVNEVSMEIVKVLRERDTPSTLKKEAEPDDICNLASLFCLSGRSSAVPSFVESAVIVRSFCVTLMVGVSL